MAHRRISPDSAVSTKWAGTSCVGNAMRGIDKIIGDLVAGLDKRGVLDNTVILFMSDNGGNAESGPDGRIVGRPVGAVSSFIHLGMNWATLNNTPFRRYKHFTHEGGVATPLIAHWPQEIPASQRGRFIHQPAHLVDVMPTVFLCSRVRPTNRHAAIANILALCRR
ncbi:MAG: sulfatase-like hydrolase/transferase [Bryobacteraceae bacterium]